MCSYMGDTAATTFQLLYEVNEDVIIANVAWAISDLRLKEATLQSCCDFAPLYFLCRQECCDVPSPILVRLNIFKINISGQWTISYVCAV